MSSLDYTEVGEELGKRYLMLVDEYGKENVLVGTGIIIFILGRIIYKCICFC
jgi:hypothetical protein